MSDDAAKLVAGLASNPRARPRIVEHFRVARANDPRGDGVGDLLDQLAIAGATNDTCLETLLELLLDYGLARPAIRNLLLNESDIADVEQRTLAAVALKLSSFERRSRFTTWMHTIATNEARMLLRSRSRRPEAPAAAGEIPEGTFLARLSTLLGDRDLVARALATLPEDQRTVLTLREVDGLEYQEISDQLQVPIGTVRSRLSRAREAMASAVREAQP